MTTKVAVLNLRAVPMTTVHGGRTLARSASSFMVSESSLVQNETIKGSWDVAPGEAECPDTGSLNAEPMLVIRDSH